MNPRHVLAVCGVIVLLVNFVAEEGGLLDTLADGAPPTAKEPPASVSQRPRSIDSGATAKVAFASASDLGIGDYQADDGADGPPSLPAEDAQFSYGKDTAASRFPNGALTDEQLGVEKPTGLAPVNITDI